MLSRADRILGLDMSSTAIGWSLLVGDKVEAFGDVTLEGDIGQRCNAAANEVARLHLRYAPALTVIEAPVARFAKSVIPQARVSGAVLAQLAACRLLWHEATPTAAKLALCGDGAATKREMVIEAAQRLGLPTSDVRTWRGKQYAHAANGRRVLSEDAADAYGLALVGLNVVVEVVL